MKGESGYAPTSRSFSIIYMQRIEYSPGHVVWLAVVWIGFTGVEVRIKAVLRGRQIWQRDFK